MSDEAQKKLCDVCEKPAEKKVSLNYHDPDKLHLCEIHSWDLFLLSEGNFIKKYKKRLKIPLRFVKTKKKTGKSTLSGF